MAVVEFVRHIVTSVGRFIQLVLIILKDVVVDIEC